MAWADRVRLCNDWTEKDRTRLARLREWFNAEREGIIESLTDDMMRFNGAHTLMNNRRFTQRLNSVLEEWLTGLLDGKLDHAHAEKRRALGEKFGEVDLMFRDVILLQGMTRQHLLALAQKRLKGQPQRLLWTMQALDKALNCDMALVYTGCLSLRDAEMEQTLLDRFLAVTGFSPTLYAALAEARQSNPTS